MPPKLRRTKRQRPSDAAPAAAPAHPEPVPAAPPSEAPTPAPAPAVPAPAPAPAPAPTPAPASSVAALVAATTGAAAEGLSHEQRQQLRAHYERDPVYRLLQATHRGDAVDVRRSKLRARDCRRAAAYLGLRSTVPLDEEERAAASGLEERRAAFAESKGIPLAELAPPPAASVADPATPAVGLRFARLRSVRLQVGCSIASGLCHLMPVLAANAATLVRLDLSRNSLGPADAVALMQALGYRGQGSGPSAAALQCLDLSYNLPLGDAGLTIVLDACKGRPALRAVVLDHCAVTDRGALDAAQYLRSWLKPEAPAEAPVQFHLALNRNRIGHVGLAATGKGLPGHVSVTVASQALPPPPASRSTA